VASGAWRRALAVRQRRAVASDPKAHGVKRVSWSRVRELLDAENSPHGLGMRYSRAVTRIAQALTKLREPRPWATDEAPETAPMDALTRPSRR
jgi:hypothetical protein